MSRTIEVWFARHAQMLLSSLGSLVRQPVATAMTVGVVAIALAMPLFLSTLLYSVRSVTIEWNQAFDLSVYLVKSAGADRAQALAQQLRKRPDVAQVRVVTADEALQTFRADSGFGKALDALSDNPLPNTLIVTPAMAASTPQGTQTLKADIADFSQVELVQLDSEWVRRLDALLDVMKRVIWVTAGLLAAGIVIIVGNTIRLDILNRRSEIEVMKLVGATDRFARRPFLYSGIWYGLGGGLLAVAIDGLAVRLLNVPVARLAGLYDSRFHLSGPSMRSIWVVLGIAPALAWLGSWAAATRHIRSVRPT